MNVAEDTTLSIDDGAKSPLFQVLRDLGRVIKLSDGKHNECLRVVEIVNGWCQWVVAMSWLNASVGVR